MPLSRHHVRTTVETYLARHPYEREQLGALLDALGRPTDITSRSTFTGHVTCGAIVVDPLGRVLHVLHLPPSFLTWLHDPEPGVATRTAALLAWFPQVPGLATALTGVGFDTDTARASANLALAFLPSPPNSRELAALTACLASTNEAVRVTAAVALAHRQTTAPPDKALTVLIHADSNEVTGDSGPQQSADAERGASRGRFRLLRTPDSQRRRHRVSLADGDRSDRHIGTS
ncbi:hypothetical protein [Streptomyces sp. NBC_01334]|uniref:hypothetical protein n=1 Tax=Streptomyces sp. NBC_01334 TaxID=2903827 RepID=UPI002E124A89|nr:hypothetical protein OG736_45115 [Streptomyces sp. NBC_01334]